MKKNFQNVPSCTATKNVCLLLLIFWTNGFFYSMSSDTRNLAMCFVQYHNLAGRIPIGLPRIYVEMEKATSQIMSVPNNIESCNTTTTEELWEHAMVRALLFRNLKYYLSNHCSVRLIILSLAIPPQHKPTISP